MNEKLEIYLTFCKNYYLYKNYPTHLNKFKLLFLLYIWVITVMCRILIKDLGTTKAFEIKNNKYDSNNEINQLINNKCLSICIS